MAMLNNQMVYGLYPKLGGPVLQSDPHQKYQLRLLKI